MSTGKKSVWEAEAELYEEQDYVRAQARLDRIAEPLRSGAESDRVLYKSMEAIVLGTEPADLKEGMMVCLLERFFLRARGSMKN